VLSAGPKSKIQCPIIKHDLGSWALDIGLFWVNFHLFTQKQKKLLTALYDIDNIRRWF
jgi:hypothetical protein